MSTPELKPCPFCGGKVEFLQGHAVGDGCFISHIARDCGVELSSLQPNDMGLIAIWNTRHNPAESALNAAREAIENAPHTLFCPQHAVIPNDRPCTCWKAEALAQISPQQSKTT